MANNRFYTRRPTQTGCLCNLRGHQYNGVIVNESYDGMCIIIQAPSDTPLFKDDKVIVRFPVTIPEIEIQTAIKCLVNVRSVSADNNGTQLRIGGEIQSALDEPAGRLKIG